MLLCFFMNIISLVIESCLLLHGMNEECWLLYRSLASSMDSSLCSATCSSIHDNGVPMCTILNCPAAFLGMSLPVVVRQRLSVDTDTVLDTLFLFPLSISFRDLCWRGTTSHAIMTCSDSVKIWGNRRDLLRSATKDKYKMKGQTTRAQLNELLSCVYSMFNIPLYTR